jgi:hypothetical protein
MTGRGAGEMTQVKSESTSPGLTGGILNEIPPPPLNGSSNIKRPYLHVPIAAEDLHPECESSPTARMRVLTCTSTLPSTALAASRAPEEQSRQQVRDNPRYISTELGQLCSFSHGYWMEEAHNTFWWLPPACTLLTVVGHRSNEFYVNLAI